ncbi:MAG: outer membrane beta-barrel family protein, partial [Crocinitomicaceae bacterium]|nr:outer membrane beta-barrel family protein [Crocinitomicaceae bacterium]
DYTNLDPTVDWTNDGFNWGAKYISNIDFWKNTASAQLNLKYNAPRVTPQGIVQPRTGVDISLEKRMLEKSLTLGMRVTDVFNQKGFVLDLETEDVRQTSEYKWLTRRFYVTVSYKFGKLDKKLRTPRRFNNGEGGD